MSETLLVSREKKSPHDYITWVTAAVYLCSQNVCSHTLCHRDAGQFRGQQSKTWGGIKADKKFLTASSKSTETDEYSSTPTAARETLVQDTIAGREPETQRPMVLLRTKVFFSFFLDFLSTDSSVEVAEGGRRLQGRLWMKTCDGAEELRLEEGSTGSQ